MTGRPDVDRGLALDVLVIGSGVAGLSAAVRLAHIGGARVGVLTKGELEQSTTRWAQGGIAAVLPGDEDSTDLHLADTLRAGAGLCDETAVRVLVDEGPARVNELIALGAVFDKVPGGGLSRAREGGHSAARVLHAGGLATGAEVERALVEAVRSSAAALFERFFALDLIVSGGRCRGVVALGPTGGPVRIEATEVILASGGAGQMFAVTTNPTESTGDGIAMALRAGVPVADVEFVQFHPTALHHPAMPRPLFSEALRGHGALLRDHDGQRFIDELLPRDAVSQAIAATLAASGREHVYLDVTGLEDFARRFPTIQVALDAVGLDPAHDWLPVAPAAHYLSGGLLTDLDGASAMPGLWAAGEAACSGVHGANRLASNSLLEGMVFGARCVDAIFAGTDRPRPTGALAGWFGSEGSRAAPAGSVPVDVVDQGRRPEPGEPVQASLAGLGADEVERLRAELQATMTANAGVVRDRASIATAVGDLDRLGLGVVPPSEAPGRPVQAGRAAAELRNLAEVARALLASASLREETRGCHARADFPKASPCLVRRFAHAAGRVSRSAR